LDSGLAFHLGPVSVRWYGILIATGVLLGYLVAYFRTRARGQDPEHISNILVVSIVAAIVGARLYYVIFSFNNYRGNLKEVFAIWHGGLAIHGGIIGALIALIVYTNYQKLDFWYWADLMVPSLILGQAIGRWGNFFNQEAFGYPTKLPWGIYIPPAKRPVGYLAFTHFHPTFLYESLWDILGFILLILLARYQLKKSKLLPAGSILFAYGIYYSFGRFWIEGLRTDSLYLGPLRAAQVISIIIIALSTLLYFYRRERLSKN